VLYSRYGVGNGVRLRRADHVLRSFLGGPEVV
jgi:hypothetical protein